MSLPWNKRVEEVPESRGEDNADTVSPLDSCNKPQTFPVSAEFYGFRSNGPCIKDVRAVHSIQAQAGFVGLLNLGNTCFMNSGLQCLLSNSSVVKFFLEDFKIDESSQHTLTGKFALVLRKCWSGLFSRLHPLEFRNAMGASHTQFQEFRQHDCQEFLAVLLDTLHEHLNIGQRPTKAADSCGSGEGTVGGEDGAVSMDCSADDDESDDSSESDFENSEISSTSDETRCPSCPPSTSNVSSTGDGCPTEPTAPNQLCGVSEDSNLSEPSRASTDSGVSDRSCVSRCTPNPENTEAQPGADGHCAVVPSKDVAASASERISSVEDEFKDAAGNGVEGEASEVDGDASERKMPSIEDFCNKDTKTLNTNVLANDYLHEKVSTDSAKYHKTDDKNARLSSAIQDEAMNVCDQLNDLLTCDGGKGTCKPVKDTNLLANCQDKFSDDGGGGGGKKVLFSERDANDECSVNNAKRIKVDEDKKNVRMQAKLKVNTEQNRTKDLLKTKTTGGRLNEDASHSSSSMSEGPSLSVQRSANSAGASRLSEDNCAKKSASHADREWLRYTRENKSIIVDTFQGQFKSTMVCLECHHVSVTFEPFMYLSVPLPNAVDRQIGVIFVPCYGQQPCRYLVVVNKFDHVSTIRQKLIRMIGENPCDIILAEVFNNHVARILDNSMDVKYVNDSGRLIYAFEMLPAPRCDEVSMEHSSANDVLRNDSDENILPPPPNEDLVLSTSDDDDKTTPRHSSSSADISNFESPGANQETCCPSLAMEVDVSSHVESSAGNLLNNSYETADLKVASKPDMSWHNNSLQPSSSPENSPGDSFVADAARKSRLGAAWGDGATAVPPAVPLGAEDVAGHDVQVSKYREDDAASGGSNDSEFSFDVAQSQWRTCAICLEEMLDTDLLIHPPCDGILCHACLEMSYRHYFRKSWSICAICGMAIDSIDAFVRLNIGTHCKPSMRILSVPVMYRNGPETDEIGHEPGFLFGHPHILYLPSTLTGELLYEMVDQMVPSGVEYSVVLTDGEGYRCSRCLYTQHCSGCEVRRDQQLTLRPSDHLTVKFTDLATSYIVGAEQFVDHESMENIRESDDLTLYDCFRAFMESETLDEHNPWFCPVCCENRCARKTMTVWRYPRTLVVYLKRFVYHELSSTKIDSKVEFPVDNLDLSGYTSGPRHETNLQYELQSCVCHFGGAHLGHYTAYAKHPITLEWHYFNDEMAVKSEPQGADCPAAYILFYERKGSRVPLCLPRLRSRKDVTKESTSTIPMAPPRCIIEEVDEPVEEDEKPDLGESTSDLDLSSQSSADEHEFYK